MKVDKMTCGLLKSLDCLVQNESSLSFRYVPNPSSIFVNNTSFRSQLFGRAASEGKSFSLALSNPKRTNKLKKFLSEDVPAEGILAKHVLTKAILGKCILGKPPIVFEHSFHGQNGTKLT